MLQTDSVSCVVVQGEKGGCWINAKDEKKSIINWHGDKSKMDIWTSCSVTLLCNISVISRLEKIMCDYILEEDSLWPGIWEFGVKNKTKYTIFCLRNSLINSWDMKNGDDRILC